MIWCRDGLHVSLGFFDDIFIPNHYFPEPSFFNEDKGIWFWRYTDAEGIANSMDVEFGKDIRVRVECVKFPAIPAPDSLKLARGKLAVYCCFVEQEEG